MDSREQRGSETPPPPGITYFIDWLFPEIWHHREQGAVRQESTWGKEEEEEEGKKEESEEDAVPATEAQHPSAGAEEQEVLQGGTWGTFMMV